MFSYKNAYVTTRKKRTWLVQLIIITKQTIGFRLLSSSWPLGLKGHKQTVSLQNKTHKHSEERLGGSFMLMYMNNVFSDLFTTKEMVNINRKGQD